MSTISTAVSKVSKVGLARHLLKQLSSAQQASPLTAGRSARYTCSSGDDEKVLFSPQAAYLPAEIKAEPKATQSLQLVT